MNILYFTHPLNGLLMIGLPIGLGIYLVHRFKLSWSLWWAGGLTFIVSQIAHIPFNLLILNPWIDAITSSFSMKILAILISAIFLGFSAGIFEETARYAVLRWWQKDIRTWSKGLLYGAGHGSIEAIILGLLVLFTFYQMISLRGSDLNSLVPAEYLSLVQQQINAYWSVSWQSSLLGAIERTLTIPFHISAALLVVQTFTRGQARWLWLAIVWHTIVDALVVTASQLWGIYIAEGLLGLTSIISLVVIFALKNTGDEAEEELPPLNKPKTIEMLQLIDISKDELENTRYD